MKDIIRKGSPNSHSDTQMNLHRDSHKEFQTGSIVTLLSFIAVVIVGLYVLAFFAFGKVVPPNMIGVRQNYFSFGGILKDGYQERGLVPGLHWKIPGFSEVLLLPRDFQFINMDGGEVKGDLTLPKLEIPTADGSKVKTDITLVVRYFSAPGKGTMRTGAAAELVAKDITSATDVPVVTMVPREHGGPKDLVNNYSVTVDRQLATFSRKAEESIKRWLSALSTIDYYNPNYRESAAFRATEEVNTFSNREGIELWGTLIRRYVYAEKKIDDQIFAKNLQDATERLNASQSKLAKAKAATEELRAFWDGQKIGVLKEEGDAKSRILDEEAKRYEAVKRAEGDAQVEIAHAFVEEEKNKAFVSSGGNIYVARKLVPIIKSLKGGVVNNIDPYDVEAWVRKLVGQGE